MILIADLRHFADSGNGHVAKISREILLLMKGETPSKPMPLEKLQKWGTPNQNSDRAKVARWLIHLRTFKKGT